ncbi:MAG TPA: hypothetical protein VN620_18725 [Candidatus Methylomirabilis sp.]|nr:hypothetical protein [Candidatus Methylomirabilis sp.]
MTPITRRDVLAHQTAVPWPSQRQVEQDLLLCKAMAAVFNDRFHWRPTRAWVSRKPRIFLKEMAG